jgi:hypothetical protein
MEENKILVPIIKLGAIVRIRPGTRFYGESPGNPRDIPGKIVEGESAWLSVKWNNGCINNYEVCDLDFEEDTEMVEVDANKIYFEEPDVEIHNMNDLLETLYPKEKNGYAVATYYTILATGEKLRQCKKEKMRSFDDIWMLANAYMPGIDVKDVFKGLLLYNTTPKEIEKKVLIKSFSNCSTMKRIRYTNSLSSIDNVMRNIDKNKYDSIYSWKELFNMLDIKDSKDLIEWYEQQFKAVV